MKQRITGRINEGHYEILGLDGQVIQRTPLAEAKQNTKLAAAIKRNGWAALPEA